MPFYVLTISQMCPNLNFFFNRTRHFYANQNSNPVIAAGCYWTSKKRESEVTSLHDELQAQVSALRQGNRDAWASLPGPSVHLTCAEVHASSVPLPFFPRSTEEAVLSCHWLAPASESHQPAGRSLGVVTLGRIIQVLSVLYRHFQPPFCLSSRAIPFGKVPLLWLNGKNSSNHSLLCLQT